LLIPFRPRTHNCAHQDFDDKGGEEKEEEAEKNYDGVAK
jgi:hypothetical protein